MNFGGPVWHASALAATEGTAWAMAERALRGVGDPKLGEWREVGVRAVHLRRRLTGDERASVGGMDVRDIRGTTEESARLAALLRDAPHLRPLVSKAETP